MARIDTRLLMHLREAMTEDQWLRSLRADLNVDEALEIARLVQQIPTADEAAADAMSKRIDEILMVATP